MADPWPLMPLPGKALNSDAGGGEREQLYQVLIFSPTVFNVLLHKLANATSVGTFLRQAFDHSS